MYYSIEIPPHRTTETQRNSMTADRLPLHAAHRRRPTSRQSPKLPNDTLGPVFSVRRSFRTRSSCHCTMAAVFRRSPPYIIRCRGNSTPGLRAESSPLVGSLQQPRSRRNQHGFLQRTHVGSRLVSNKHRGMTRKICALCRTRWSGELRGPF